MKNFFWNSDERRLRAAWRLILFLPLLEIPLVVVSFLLDVLFGSSGLYYLAKSLGSALTFVGVLWLAGKYLDHRRLAEYGFHLNRAWWIDFGFGLGLGALLMGLVFVAELGSGWLEIRAQPGVSAIDFWWAILNAMILFIVVGISEEVSFRAFFLRNLAEGLNLKRIGPFTALINAFVISSAIFGLLHLGNANASWVSSLNIALAGILLGLGLVLSGEMAIPIGLHIGWNFFQGNVFGFPVSGGGAGASFIAIQQGGPDLLTGGAFGPEGGLLGLSAIMLGCLLTIGWVRFRRGKVKLQTDLAVYQESAEKQVSSRKNA